MMKAALFNDHPCQDFNTAQLEGIIGGKEVPVSDEFISYNLIHRAANGQPSYFPIKYCPFCGYQFKRQAAPQDRRFYPKIF